MKKSKGHPLDFDTEIARFLPKQLNALDQLDLEGVKYLLYGGAMGGGKSYLIRWGILRQLIKLSRDYKVDGIMGMLACEDYPTLRDRQLSKISVEFPDWMGVRKGDDRDYGNCFILAPEYGGGVLCFRNLDDPSKYMSAEFAVIAIDELTKNSYQTFTNLRTRLRWPGIPDIECKFIGGTNPGGIGHGWCKQFWIDRQLPAEWLKPVDHSKEFGFIRSLADDNPFLDQSYWQSLETLPPALRRAYRYGDWNIFAGQAFPELIFDVHHYNPSKMPIPPDSWLGMSFDWGFGRPFSIGWWFSDAVGRLYRFGEWYGWNGTADQGVRLTDSQIADGIIEREKNMGIWGRPVYRKALPDCFSKKPDYKGGGQGPSTAEEFRKKGLVMTPADPNRKLKVRQFQERLKVENGFPMMLISDRCDQFWRTIPQIITDSVNLEDIDTKGEDHVYDEVCAMLMSRPMASISEVKVIRRPPRDASEVADLERKEIFRELEAEDGRGNTIPAGWAW